jgi:hypothetical protein
MPPTQAPRTRARRVTGATIAGVVVFCAVLGGLYGLKLSDLAAAESERDDTRQEVARLQAEVDALAEYRQLGDAVAARNTLLGHAMSEEVSWASILNDLALTFPASGSLRTLDATLRTPGEEAQPGTVAFGDPVADITFTGYSVERVAPGVETVLIRSDEVDSFFNTFLVNSTAEEIGDTEVTGFSASVQLNEEARTGRYAEGLPPEETP